jgi:hypothetical protein
MTCRRPSISPAVSSSRGQLVGVGTVERAAVRLLHLRDVDAPFDRILLRTDDHALAGKFHAAPLGVVHQFRDRGPGLAGRSRIDAVQPKHHGRVEHAALAVAVLERRAGPGREIAVARAVDEHAADDRGAAGLGLHDQRANAVVLLHHDPGAERVEQDFGVVAEQKVVGGALVGRGVVGLRLDLAERHMRRIEPAEPVDARQEFIGDAMHHLAVLAVDIGVQPAERGHAGSRAHAAKETVTFDHERLAAERGRRRGRRDASRPAAQHDHVVLAAHGHLPLRLADGLCRHWGMIALLRHSRMGVLLGSPARYE